MDRLPHGTSNTALAFAFYISGIPFADEKTPLTNTYDRDILRGLGYNGPIEQAAAKAFSEGRKGHVSYGFLRASERGEAAKAFDAQSRLCAASDASAEGLFRLVIQRHAGGLVSLTEALSGATCIILKRWRAELREWGAHADYQTQRNAMKIKDYDARELAEAVFLTGNFHAFAAVLMEARVVFLSMFLNYPPIIRLHRAGSPKVTPTHNGKRVKAPGFVLYSTNAERETRRHLGAPTK